MVGMLSHSPSLLFGVLGAPAGTFRGVPPDSRLVTLNKNSPMKYDTRKTTSDTTLFRVLIFTHGY